MKTFLEHKIEWVQNATEENQTHRRLDLLDGLRGITGFFLR